MGKPLPIGPYNDHVNIIWRRRHIKIIQTHARKLLPTAIGVIRHVEFTFQQIGGGTVCNLRFFFFFFSVAMYWPERCRLRNTIVLKRCCVSLRWVPRYTIIFHGNIRPKYLLGTCVITLPCRISNIKGVDIF